MLGTKARRELSRSWAQDDINRVEFSNTEVKYIYVNKTNSVIISAHW